MAGLPVRSRRRASLTPRPSARAARATRPSPFTRARNAGSEATVTSTAIASSAGRMVSAGDSDGAPKPSHMTMPRTATAAKLTPDLMRKKATVRVATCSAGMPPRRSTHTPRASPPSPPAGISEPTPSSARPSSTLVRGAMRAQKIGPNMST